MNTYIKSIALAAVASLGLASCSDFLDRPTEDNYVADNYYQTDTQCLNGTSYLYSSPWSDFTRNFVNVGEVLSGNFYAGSNDPYHDFTLNSSDSELGNMSASLWSVIAHCNTVYNYIAGASGPSEAAKNQTMGECLVWKAMAYFFLVRSFGEVPIIHDNTAELNSGTYNSLPKAKKADVYEYIIMTLEKATDILPDKPMQAGRIDLAAAQGLMAKVYLTKAGVSGAINTEDLDQAVRYAKLCVAHANHDLMPNYADQYRLANNINPECLISWRWNASNNQWTDQSFMQCDYAPEGFDENGDVWGGWKGMSTDLQEAFGIKVLEQQPDVWLNNRDTRLKATMMLAGFKYDYFWTDRTMKNGNKGFDYLQFSYDPEYNPSAHFDQGKYMMESPTGAMPVKHLYGDNADHIAGVGYSAGRMANALATHILRLADVYLVLAEAKLLLANPANPQEAVITDSSNEGLAAINKVRTRAGVNPLTKLDWNAIWLERRLELAFEGDRWYDFVRVSYYNPQFCIDKLKNQKRNVNYGVDELYRTYWESGETEWKVTSDMHYDDQTPALGDANIKQLMKEDPDSHKMYFALPFTTQDITFNPNLAASAPAEHIDVRELYHY